MAITPNGVLLCDPRYFDVIDVKNPFMAEGAAVDKTRALEQWKAMAGAFRATGARVVVMDPVSGCEDMVFCANTALTGVDGSGVKRAVVSRMTYFEGGGDAVWHAGQNRLFAGSGFRTEPQAYDFVKEIFDCEIVPLTLHSSHFYHLDTCFCVVDERTALIYPPAFTKGSYERVRGYFTNIIEAGDDEAMHFSCNACSIAGAVIIEQSAVRTIQELRDRGFTVVPVDTSEFLKSGGSVYCMKQYLF